MFQMPCPQSPLEGTCGVLLLMFCVCVVFLVTPMVSVRTMERPTMTAAYGFFIIAVPGTSINISCTDGIQFLHLWNFTPGVFTNFLLHRVFLSEHYLILRYYGCSLHLADFSDCYFSCCFYVLARTIWLRPEWVPDICGGDFGLLREGATLTSYVSCTYTPSLWLLLFWYAVAIPACHGLLLFWFAVAIPADCGFYYQDMAGLVADGAFPAAGLSFWFLCWVKINWLWLGRTLAGLSPIECYKRLLADACGAIVLHGVLFWPSWILLWLCGDCFMVCLPITFYAGHEDRSFLVHELSERYLYPRTLFWTFAALWLICTLISRFFTAAGLVDWSYLSRQNCTNCLAFHNCVRAVALFC
jgi:hypothetical protein